jgi:hypothetical protein
MRPPLGVVPGGVRIPTAIPALMMLFALLALIIAALIG